MIDLLNLIPMCQVLDFYQVNFGETILLLREGLLAAKGLQEIKISQSNLGDEGALALAKLFSSNEKSQVQTLSLIHCGIGDKGLVALLSNYTGCSLTYQSGNFTETSASIFSSFLQEKSHHLKYLSLANVKLGPVLSKIFEIFLRIIL